jgi:carotenoid cleavage dioxygenase-like enzyme
VVQRRREYQCISYQRRKCRLQAEIRTDRKVCEGGASTALLTRSVGIAPDDCCYATYCSSHRFTGRYRNKYTDAVEFAVRSTANTNIVFFRGMLLACKEDSPPYAMDPDTLETLGLWDFDGQLPSLTFTAHPKFDPVTREMICFGYEARGDGTPDVCYWSVQPDGKFSETVWMVAPVAGLIHDFAVTKNYVSALPAFISDRCNPVCWA